MDWEIVVLRNEKISDPLHVDLHVAHPDRVLDISRARENARENLLNYSGNDALLVFIINIGAHHCVRLSGTCLAVCEDCAIVAIEDIVDGGSDGEVEDICLTRRHIEDTIEGEGPLGLVRVDSACVLGIEVDNGLTAAGNLDFVLRSKPRNDFDSVVAPSTQSVSVILGII